MAYWIDDQGSEDKVVARIPGEAPNVSFAAVTGKPLAEIRIVSFFKCTRNTQRVRGG